MANELLLLTALSWVAGGMLALAGTPAVARAALALGAALGIAAAVAALPAGTAAVALPTMEGAPVRFRMDGPALWLFGFGLAPALLASLIGSPGGGRTWSFGASCSLLGALGVFGVEDGVALLISWEVMSLGGAVLLLGDRAATAPGRPVLFMLALLEVGAVALLLGILLLGHGGGSLSFAALEQGAASRSAAVVLGGGLLLLVGFGAKLGLVPFYEWFPGAYGVGSGASGVLLSGIVLNAAFAALSRAVLGWMPATGTPVFGLGMVVTLAGVVTAVLAILYAFQQDDWRRLLSLSSAENAAISVSMLGAALIFRAEGHPELGSLAWTVSLIHLGGHALTKGALFLAADGVAVAGGSYAIRHATVARSSSAALTIGAVLAGMSLAAMPPEIGFASEWYAFQTVFQGFRLPDLAARLTLALAGAGLALTAAIALSTFVKAIGIGLFGGGAPAERPVRRRTALATLLLGGGGLLAAASMPVLLGALPAAQRPMRDGLLLVPLTAKFAFISPTLLVGVMPLLAILPIGLVLLAARARAPRATDVWYGGSVQDGHRVATTSLTFSNALRTFYGSIYRPAATLEQNEADRSGYFVQSLRFRERVRSIFEPMLFDPAVRLVQQASDLARRTQSGNLNAYLGVIAMLLALSLLAALIV